MKGIFNIRPPKCRYIFTWSVGKVLSYLATKNPLIDLSLKVLTLKCVALIALASAQRSQTLGAIDIKYIIWQDTSVILKINSLLKTSRPKHTDCEIILHKYHNEAICPVRTLRHYLLRTANVRKSNKLFISFKTFKNVSTSTIARWLKLVLSESGIDVSKFKAHSFRGASTSAAKNAGVSLKDILKTANWSSASTFHKFYFKEVETQRINYTDAVFSNSL